VDIATLYEVVIYGQYLLVPFVLYKNDLSISCTGILNNPIHDKSGEITSSL